MRTEPHMQRMSHASGSIPYFSNGKHNVLFLNYQKCNRIDNFYIIIPKESMVGNIFESFLGAYGNVKNIVPITGMSKIKTPTGKQSL